MLKNKWILIFLPCLLMNFFVFVRYSSAQSGAAGSDAIGVRIVPNPNHYSIYRWYESQGFKGSPQALTVDGYEAVRDGRTVYVNAANIDVNTKTIYTNIYLISYNQDPVAKTVDVLGQIISHWKFNNNLVENTNPAPTCAISSINCVADAGCGKDQLCATSTIASGSCVLKNPKNCLTDFDCPNNFFCNSTKAKIVRDLKRVGKLGELNEALFKFKNLNNHYPSLEAGSYLPNHTVSVWPSWVENFLSNLTIAKNFFDPINRLGDCPGYDPKTCWDKEAKKFVYTPTPSYLMLPLGSYALVYKTDANSSNYSLCAVMESREPSLNYHFSPNDPASSACVTATGILSGGTASNTIPILIDKSLTGEAGQEFNGFFKVIDQEGNPLTWTLNTSAANWAGWKNNNSQNQPPVLKDTNSANQKKVYAQEAGPAGDYNVVLNVSDGQGGVLSTSTSIKIINSLPFIEAADGEYVLDPNIPFGYTFNFSGKNFSTPGSSYVLTRLSGPFDLLNSPILVKTFSSAGINRYQVNFQGLIPTSYQFSVNTDFIYRLKVTDRFNASSTKQFKIRFLVENPPLNFSCPTSARLGKTYSCALGKTNEGNHTLTYTGSNLPAGLAIVIENGQQQNNTNNNYYTLNSNNNQPAASFKDVFHSLASFIYQLPAVDAASGNLIAQAAPQVNWVYLKGTPTASSSGTVINIKAVNEYSASSTRNFTLKINNYCGDGQKQIPNFEGRAGIYNDGYEDCDGNDGITSNPTASSPEKQYGCMTGVGALTPYPIISNTYCVFKSPIDGGGYCGDGYCQATIETSINCSADCAQGNPTCTPDCIGKNCGSDGCSGLCGTCPQNQACSNGQCTQNSCGNGNCQANIGENCKNCVQDCACPSNKPICDNTGTCVANQPNCQGPNQCMLCDGVNCFCGSGQLCKNGLCYFKSNCKCSNSNLSSMLEVCHNANSNLDTCCNPGAETCCNGACVNDPNQLKETCGYGNCCTKSYQTCCGNTMASKMCRNNTSLTQCGPDYCCPGQICCDGYCQDPSNCGNNNFE